MNRKRKIVVVSAISILSLMLTASWGVLSTNAWPTESTPVYSLAGIWTTMIPVSAELASINSFVISTQDSEGIIYTVVGKHPQCSPTLLGYFPEGERLSDMMGYCVRIGANTFRFGAVWQGIKEGGTERMGIGEVVFMGVISGTLELVDADKVQYTGTVAGYGPDQDADGDRLPDEGAVPLVCAPFSLTFKRLPMPPSCEPTPMP